VPYPVESVGQDVHQEPPDELVRLERHGFVAAGSLDPKVMSAVESCRTVALGGHVMRCEDCLLNRIGLESLSIRSGTEESWRRA
jgi:hypothetical protein